MFTIKQSRLDHLALMSINWCYQQIGFQQSNEWVSRTKNIKFFIVCNFYEGSGCRDSVSPSVMSHACHTKIAKVALQLVSVWGFVWWWWFWVIRNWIYNDFKSSNESRTFRRVVSGTGPFVDLVYLTRLWMGSALCAAGKFLLPSVFVRSGWINEAYIAMEQGSWSSHVHMGGNNSMSAGYFYNKIEGSNQSLPSGFPCGPLLRLHKKEARCSRESRRINIIQCKCLLYAFYHGTKFWDQQRVSSTVPCGGSSDALVLSLGFR